MFACIVDGADAAGVARLEDQLRSLEEPQEEQELAGPDGPPPPGWKSDAENYAAVQAWTGKMASMTRG